MDIKYINLERYQRALALYEQLKIEFPNCFFPLGTEHPLKIGIYQDLIKLPAYSTPEQRRALKDFLMLYTSSISYRAALIVPNALRIDLNGCEVGIISAKARYIAKTQCHHIIWELDSAGYEQQKRLAQHHKKQGTYTPEVMASLFPPTPKKEKLKKSPAPLLKQPKPVVTSKSKEETSKPSKGAQPKKPVTIIIKKKKIFDNGIR